MKEAIGPYMGMIMAECAQVGLMILSKAAMSETNMAPLIFVFYSNSLASLILLPSSLLLHRSDRDRPPLTFPIVGGFFLLGLLGLLAQAFGYAGINLSSPTLATSMLNLVPGFTFILAVLFRMEKFQRTSSTVAKSLGTIVTISGAFILTYYKGPEVLQTITSLHQFFLGRSNWVLGGCLLAIDCVMTSAWVIVQAMILKQYTAELIVVFFYCFFVTILSAIVCLVTEREASAWSLRPTIRWMSILYSGVFGSAFQVGVTTWCLRRTGPVFVSMFKPLGIVIAAAVGVAFQGDKLYLGSLVGAIVIVVGFYSVMWGKTNEKKVENSAAGLRDEESSSQKVSLLQESAQEV